MKTISKDPMAIAKQHAKEIMKQQQRTKRNLSTKDIQTAKEKLYHKMPHTSSTMMINGKMMSEKEARKVIKTKMK